MYCYYIILALPIGLITTTCISNKTNDEPTFAILPNEKCKLRPTLIVIEPNEDVYFPAIISLHRCQGSCNTERLSPTRKCKIEKYRILFVNIRNKLSQENKYVKVKNHTACSCKCLYNNSFCSSTQRWSEKDCRCNCEARRYKCPLNNQWNPNICKCECNMFCKHRDKVLNSTSCRCNCRPEIYMRCSKDGKLLLESDCKCTNASTSIMYEDCSTLPPKWVVIFIITISASLCVLIFDCIACGRKIGCVYLLIQYFHVIGRFIYSRLMVITQSRQSQNGNHNVSSSTS